MKTFRELIEEKAKEACNKYPMAIITYYGPNDEPENEFISQVIVSIIQDKDKQPELIRKWRADTNINAQPAEIVTEISTLITEHNVHSVAIVDKVIGDADQGSIDYPVTDVDLEAQTWGDQ